MSLNKIDTWNCGIERRQRKTNRDLYLKGQRIRNVSLPEKSFRRLGRCPYHFDLHSHFHSSSIIHSKTHLKDSWEAVWKQSKAGRLQHHQWGGSDSNLHALYCIVLLYVILQYHHNCEFDLVILQEQAYTKAFCTRTLCSLFSPLIPTIPNFQPLDQFLLHSARLRDQTPKKPCNGRLKTKQPSKILLLEAVLTLGQFIIVPLLPPNTLWGHSPESHRPASRSYSRD